MDADQRGVWERIAASFDRTRSRPWPHVEAFLRGLPRGARVLDLMGGNGRHLASAKACGLEPVWLDWSRELGRIVRKRHPDVHAVVADARHVPFPDATFDAAIYVAGLHGIPTAEGRLASLRELRRVLKPGGQAQVTVWSRDAPRFREAGSPGEPVDVVVPWKAEGRSEERTYHLYTNDELGADLATAGLSCRSLGATVGDAENLVAAVNAPSADAARTPVAGR